MSNLPRYGNDNFIAHKLYQGQLDHFPYVPTARYLIEKYIPYAWKRDCNAFEFIDTEILLCISLSMPSDCDFSRKWKLEELAKILGVHPLTLYNDQYLSL